MVQKITMNIINGQIHLGLRSVKPKFTSTVISILWMSTEIFAYRIDASWIQPISAAICVCQEFLHKFNDSVASIGTSITSTDLEEFPSSLHSLLVNLLIS